MFKRKDWPSSCMYLYCPYSEIGTALQHSYFSPGSVFHYERLGCCGNENSLLECRSRRFVTNDCNHGNEAGLVCAEPEGEPGVSGCHMHAPVFKPWLWWLCILNTIGSVHKGSW